MKKLLLFGVFILLIVGGFFSYTFFFQDSYIIEDDFAYFKFYDQTQEPLKCYVAGSQSCESYEGYYRFVKDNNVKMDISVSVTDSVLDVNEILDDLEIKDDVYCDHDYHNTKYCSFKNTNGLFWISENIYVQFNVEGSEGLQPGMEEDIFKSYMEKYPSTIK